jgi:DNA replication protein DnaC
MKISPYMFEPYKYKHPSIEEVKEVQMFYEKRLSELGYKNRDSVSFTEICNYFSRYYFGIRHIAKEDIKDRFDKPKRSMFLFGNTGAGKTLAIQIFSKIFGIEFFFADDLARIYAIEGEKYFWYYLNDFDGKDIIIDDLGSEREVKKYGNKSPFVDFLFHREKMYKKNRVLTHFTTNATNRDVLIEKYGDRVVSRLLGMCEFIRINAPDARVVQI